MTLVEPAHFDQIIARLRDRGHDVRHFAPLPTRDTVLRRLRDRGLGSALRGSLRRTWTSRTHLRRV